MTLVLPARVTNKYWNMSTAKVSASAYFWITATLIAASLEPVIVKLGYANNCTPWQLLCLKSIVGAVLIWPLARQRCWVGIDGLRSIMAPALLLLCTSTMMLLSLQFLQASLLITIMTATPAAVAIVNQALGRDILGMKFWSGFLLAAGGLWLSLGGADLGKFHATGIILAFLAVASSCTYRVILEKTTRAYKPALVSTYIFSIHGLLSLPLTLFVFHGGISSSLLAMGAFLGLAAAMANVAFLYAISLLGSTRVSIITMLQRPLVIALTAIILKEELSLAQIAGIVLVVIGVQLAEVKRKKESVDTDTAKEKTVC